MAICRDFRRILEIDLVDPDDKFQCISMIVDKDTKVRQRCQQFIHETHRYKALHLIGKMDQSTNWPNTTDMLELATHILCSRFHSFRPVHVQLAMNTWKLKIEKEMEKWQKEKATVLIIERELSLLKNPSEIESRARAELNETNTEGCYPLAQATLAKQTLKNGATMTVPILASQPSDSVTATKSTIVVMQRVSRPRSPLKTKPVSTHNSMSLNKVIPPKGAFYSQTINSVHASQGDIVDIIPTAPSAEIHKTTETTTPGFTAKADVLTSLYQRPDHVQELGSPVQAEVFSQKPPTPPDDVTSLGSADFVPSLMLEAHLPKRQQNIPHTPPDNLDNGCQGRSISAPPETVQNISNSSKPSLPPPGIPRKPVAAQRKQVVAEAPETPEWDENWDRAQEQNKNKLRLLERIRDKGENGVNRLLKKVKGRLSNAESLELVRDRGDE